MQANDILNSLTDDKVIKIMKELGSKEPIINTSNPNEIIFSTICHCGHKHKLYYYKDSKYFKCYTNCGTLSIFDIVMNVKHFTFPESIHYLKNQLGLKTRCKGGFKLSTNIDEDWNILDSYRRVKTVKPKLQPIDNNILNVFEKYYYQGWIDEHISIEAMQKFNISYYAPQNCIVIPHYDMWGNLVGIRRRTLIKELVDEGKKYMPLYLQNVGYAHQLRFNLYGLKENQETIKRLKKVALFEAEKSILQVESYYPNNNFSLGLCGSTVTYEQRDLILSLGVEEVIFCFDREYEEVESEEYYKYMEKIEKIIKKFTPYVNVYVVWDIDGVLGMKQSPSDNGKETLEYLLKNKQYVETEVL